MSGKLRELKNRIRSVENTKKITHAMEMVAAAKLRRFQNMMVQARPYTEGLEALLKRLHQTLPSEGAKSHPFFQTRAEKRSAVVLITSDSGLCGSYNLTLIDRALDFLKGRGEACLAPTTEKILIGVGKAGINALKRRGYAVSESFTEIRPVRFEEIMTRLRSKIESLYLQQEADSVYVVYSHFLTLSSYKDVVEKILPLEKLTPVSGVTPAKTGAQEVEYLFEPSPEFIFERLIPVYFEAKIRQMFLEATVSEQIARMIAMHLATENAKEMIDALVLQRNKARQAAITKEIIEIVSGSQALKLK